MDRSKKKDAVTKVIAAMTVGKDVSPLFPGAPPAGWVLVLAGACMCCSSWVLPHACARPVGSTSVLLMQGCALLTLRAARRAVLAPPTPADVINQMQTDDMELKKLVYL